jgi:hypothetical protein
MQAQPHTPPPLWVFPLFFVAVWALIGLLISRLSSWSVLASAYRLEGDFQGEKWGWQSGTFRLGTRFNRSITIGCNERGLYLAVTFFLRPFHPALLIPWHQISARPKNHFGFEYVELTLGREERIPLLLRAHVAERLRLNERGLAAPAVLN